MHQGRRALLLLICLALLTALVPAAPTLAEQAQVDSAPLNRISGARNGMVRVYLSSLGSPTSLDITVAGSYTADGASDLTLSGGETIRVGFDNGSGEITLTSGGVSYRMGSEMGLRRHASTGSSGLKIAQARKPGNLYPGDLYLTAQKSGSGYKLYAIVHVYMEYYLCGVVPYEMGNSANIEALKAQAVAARTYTLNKMNLRSSSLYDVVDTTNDQVYYGNSDTTARCTEAVNATKGIVAMNGSSLTATYYTASNGGQTESAKNAWGSSGYDYLAVKDDPFDLMNSASSVKSAVVYGDNTTAAQPSALKSLLQQKAAAAVSAMGYSSQGATVTRITAVTPHTPKYASPSRLYTKMDFTLNVACKTSSGAAAEVQTDVTCDIFSELESALNMSINSSKNELWSVTKTGSDFKLQARRYGHGIGMSQRGAMRMGALGYTYDQILGFYYNDCRRVQYTFIHTILSAIENGGDTTITTTEEPADITESGGALATVTLVGLTDRAAVRGSADAAGPVLTSVVSGSVVTVLAKGDSWTLVRSGQIVGYMLTSSLTFTGTPPTQSDETPTQISQWATVVCSGTLNLRSAAGTGAEVLTTIPNGAYLSVLGVSGSWANVRYGAYTGYASTDFLTMSDVYPGTTSDAGGNAAVVALSSVRLRKTASTSDTVLLTLSQGDRVTVLSNDGSWCCVDAGGLQGYVITSALTFTGETVETPDSGSGAPSLGEGEIEAVIRTVADSAVLYAEASESAARVLDIPRGESVVVTSRGDTWCAVRYDGQTGYVQTADLSFPSDGDSGTAIIGYARVTTASGSLNLRSQPTAGSTILTTVPRLAQVGVIRQLNDWTQIVYGSVNGYVMTTFLTMEGGATQTPEASVTLMATVTTPSGSLNLRASASSGAKVLVAIPQGARLVISERMDEWSRTTYQGLDGYVMNSFLVFDAVPTPSPTPDVTMTPPVTALPSVSPDASASPEASPDAPTDTPAPPTPTIAPTASPAPDTVSAYVSTGGGSLNLRAECSLQSAVLAKIPEGVQVTVLKRDSIWSEVSYGGLNGYVMTRYLQFSSSSGAEGTGVTAVVKTASGSLNLRETPQSGARVLLRIPRLASVTVLEKGSAWCRVSWQQTTGYAMTAFLSFDASGGVSVTPSSTPAAASSADAAWIRADLEGAVNLRASASDSAWVMATLSPGTKVTLVTFGSEWSMISSGGLNGYVMTRFLSTTAPEGTSAPTASPTPAPQEDAVIGTMVVTTSSGSLNLRETASSGARILTTIPKGAEVSLLKAGDSWCRVRYGGVTGYAMTRYLTKSGASITAVPDKATDTPAPVTAPPTSQTQETTVKQYDETLTATDAWEALVDPEEGMLNLRDWCAKTAPILAEMPKGAVVQVLEIGDMWCRIQWEELTGYCMTEYLTLYEKPATP